MLNRINQANETLLRNFFRHNGSEKCCAVQKGDTQECARTVEKMKAIRYTADAGVGQTRRTRRSGGCYSTNETKTIRDLAFNTRMPCSTVVPKAVGYHTEAGKTSTFLRHQ